MTAPDTSTAANNVEAIWVNKSSKTGFQVMGCGSHFHGENMALYVSMDVLNAAVARAEQAEAERDAALDMMAAQPMALSKALRKLGHLVPISVVSKALRAALSREGGE
jgi:hypothetical protein